MIDPIVDKDKPETSEWTRATAMAEVIMMHKEGRAGELTTGMCEALDISFESFLKFAQLDEDSQAIVIEKLAGIFILAAGIEKFGHCNQ